jgi:hypothetical protein
LPAIALLGVFQLTFGMFTFTFCELESSRLLSRRSIRFGMREARTGNCGSKQVACCHQLCPHSFGSILGRNSECLLRPLIQYPERGIWPKTKKGGGIPPAHSQFRLLTPFLIK